MHRVPVTAASLLVVLSSSLASAQTGQRDFDARLASLEARVRAASEELLAVTREIEALKNNTERTTSTAAASPLIVSARSPFVTQVLGLPSATLDRTRSLNLKPDIFVQSRFSAGPFADATLNDYAANFRITRLTTRWAGMFSQRWGAGVELQYRAAPDGVPEQLLNDAYIDFHATPWLAIRAGQFVKPFGFDVQQLDVVRESPERAMFAGYVFPGERDRGLMVVGNLEPLCPRCGIEYSAAVVNGNRFFRDSNRQANYLFRVRRTHKTLAFGGSVQLGTQITPPDVQQTNDENAFGVDAQWSLRRLGIRGEFVHANRPSTLLSREPVFAPAFVAGVRVRTVGSTLTGVFQLTSRQQLYVRFDRLAGDVVQLCPGEKDGSCKINAVNGGFRQQLTQHGFLGFDVQWKNRLSFNHDAVNTRVQLTSGVFF